MITNRFLFVIGAIVVTTALDLPTAEPAPGTPKKPVSTKYQGVTVEDPYQWLEKDDESDVKAWSDTQNQRTRQYLDQLPYRGGNRAAINRVVRKNFAQLFLACLAARAVVRDEIPAAKATAVTGHAHVG
jgi:Prolyl oligopeptidase, N-terminal beta-propeller domain